MFFLSVELFIPYVVILSVLNCFSPHQTGKTVKSVQTAFGLFFRIFS